MKKTLKIALVTLILTSACNFSYFQDPEFGEIVWDPTIAVPLGELEYSVEELFSELDDGSASIGPGADNVVTIVYEESINAQDAGDFLEVLDQNFSGVALSKTNINASPVEQVIRVEELFEYDLRLQGNEAYDSMYFKSGTIQLEFSSTVPHPISYSAEVVSITKNNQALSFSGALNSGSDDSQNDGLVNAKGLFHLDAQNQVASNKLLFRLSYDISIPVGGNLSANSGVSFRIGIRNAEYSDLFGNVGNQEIDMGARTIALNFFQIFSGGEIKFRDPKVDFVYNNSFGFPIGVDYAGVTALGKNGETIELAGTITEQRSIVNAPTIDEAGGIVTSEHQINAENSNISELFSSQPEEFRVSINSTSNPINGPSQYNFVNEMHELDATARIQIPLDMNINELVANESFDFKNGEDLKQAKRALMRVISSNDMPMGGDLEIQFLDSSGDVFYSITERPVFSAAPVGTDGRTTGETKLTTDVLLENEDLRQMEQAARVNIKARLNSTQSNDGVNVKFFDDYLLKLQVGLVVDLEVKTSGN